MSELDSRIRIRAPLRCDGIGRLDCGEDSVSGHRLAVRWLPLDANGDAAVKACEKLPGHPSLPRILQTGEVGASAFVAIDFPQGEILAARGEERLDTALLLKMAAQLSDALAAVHAQGVVHGEMSRDSVLLTPDGRASLWDMPLVIANRLSDRRGETRLMQNLVKTAPYLSPERARGEGSSQAGDVYALGVIICVSAGAPLPTASTTLAAVHLIALGQWVPRVPSSLPERWVAMVERMVAFDPAARPSAEEVARTFAEVPGQNAMTTVPEMPAVRLPPAIRAAADAQMKALADAMQAQTDIQPVAFPREVPEEIESVEVEASTPPAPPPSALDASPWVALTDSLSVSPELLADGAKNVSEAEMAALKPASRKWVMMAVAAVALVLIGVVVNFGKPSESQVATPNEPVGAEEAPLTQNPMDELVPLPYAAPKATVKAPARPPRSRTTPAVDETAQDEGTASAASQGPQPAVENAASGILGSETSTNPASELKRPSLEL